MAARRRRPRQHTRRLQSGRKTMINQGIRYKDKNKIRPPAWQDIPSKYVRYMDLNPVDLKFGTLTLLTNPKKEDYQPGRKVLEIYKDDKIFKEYIGTILTAEEVKKMNPELQPEFHKMPEEGVYVDFGPGTNSPAWQWDFTYKNLKVVR